MMALKREKVVVAMSGGVDSSVAACLLVEQGYEVTGVFMRHGTGFPQMAKAGESGAQVAVRTQRAHCNAAEARDARAVAGMLGFPFLALDVEDNFAELIDYFVDEYTKGRTPNPCAVCNDRLKFGRLVAYADSIGAGRIATGHYARLARRNGHQALLRAGDRQKDQSYVLFGLDRGLLDRLIFPLGDLTKARVRAIAAHRGLPNRDKPESMEICFVPDDDYPRLVRERRPEAFAPGDVVDTAGNLLGRHAGIAHYTIGQRRGLGIAAGKPIYVINLDAVSNTVTMGEADALLADSLVAYRANFLVDRPDGPIRAEVKIRYLHPAAAATVHLLGAGKVRVDFDRPQRAITPGQAVVFYDDDVVLGGAWIERAERKTPSHNITAPPT